MSKHGSELGTVAFQAKLDSSPSLAILTRFLLWNKKISNQPIKKNHGSNQIFLKHIGFK